MGCIRWVFLTFTFVLAACGGDNSDDPSAAGGTNSAPTIAGTPATRVTPGAAYAFAPSAVDTDGDSLSFRIQAKPTWAKFDPATGHLSGTPTASDVGVYGGIVISVSDGAAETSLPPFDVMVSSQQTVNRAPVVSGTPPTSVAANTTYSFTPSATDADGDALTFSIRNRPLWATFDTATGRLRGGPQVANVGAFENVAISVADGKSVVTLNPFTIVVTAPTSNSPPTISGVPSSTVAAGSRYAFFPSANDVDDDALVFSVKGLPSWAAFDSRTGSLTGTPPSNATGTFAGIAISVSDGKATVSLPPFAITVTAATQNNAPTIGGAPPTAATEGTQYAFQPTAGDADGDALTFTIANRPAWASFNGTTGRLQGTPSASNIRTYGNIVISVTDGKATTSLPAFAITVAAVNHPPTISGTPSASASIGKEYSFAPTASDADGDTLAYTISNKPSWATFSTSTGRLQGTPAAANVGSFSNIVIAANDGHDSAKLPAFTITVAAANGSPKISGAPPTSAMPGSQYSFTPTASDPDGNTLTFKIANKPSWASFNAATGQLQGTPSAADVGTTTGIVISVSDGSASASLASFSVTVMAIATGSATLSWQPPTQNSDGSPLTNLAGFKVYWGTSQGSYPNSVTLNNPGLTTYVVENLLPATWFFVTTSFNADGVESQYSNVASKTIR